MRILLQIFRTRIFTIIASLALWIFTAGPKLPPETDPIIDKVMSSEIPELISGDTGYVTSQGLKIWYESVLPEKTKCGTVLLITGTGGSAIYWPQNFISALINSGYQVIRYDQRSTGLSDLVEIWDRKNPYTLADMADDAVAIIDHLDVREAHLVGLSMGGMIAQEIAIKHLGRVKSLTLMMTSGHVGDPELPQMSSRYFIGSILKGIPLLKYRLVGGEKNLIKERIAKTIAILGYEDLDIKKLAEMVLYDLRKRKGVSIKGVFQHQAAVAVSDSRYEKLKTLDTPALIIHGTEDQIFPVEHGKKLVEVIPNAKSLWLEGTGHVFPFPNMDKVMESILLHLQSS